MRESTRRWVSRIASAVVLWLVIVVVARFRGNDPDLLLVALTVAAVGTLLWLYLDAGTVTQSPLWEVAEFESVRPPGEDPRLALLTRVVGQHLDAREVGDTLQRHLVDLADHRLVTQHGVSWRADPERAAPLLGPDLVALARQHTPYPRMTLQQIDVLLSRIEAL
ncbi:MAG: hypothetical protein ABIQ59_08570 [Nocardioidaceae bacterium]